MTIQSSGAISLSNLQAEFGGSNPISLNEYYKNGGLVHNSSTNPNGIPTSGTIGDLSNDRPAPVDPSMGVPQEV